MTGVKGKSGRKKKVVELANCGLILTAAAPYAAKYLRDVIKGVIKRPSWARVEVAKFIIDHEIGKARQKTEITGAGGVPLTWKAVVELAIRKDDELEEGELPTIKGVRLITLGTEDAPEDRGSGEDKLGSKGK